MRSGLRVLGVGLSLAIAAAAALAQATVCEVPEPYEEYLPSLSYVFDDNTWRRFKCPNGVRHAHTWATSLRSRQMTPQQTLRRQVGM